jgi:ribosomal protein L37AE/L43A
MNTEKNYQCPVCKCNNTKAQYDYQHMSECNKCGSEWITDTNEVTLHAHDDVS